MTIYGDNGIKHAVLKDSMHLFSILNDAAGNQTDKEYAIAILAHGLEASLLVESECPFGE